MNVKILYFIFISEACLYLPKTKNQNVINWIHSASGILQCLVLSVYSYVFILHITKFSTYCTTKISKKFNNDKKLNVAKGKIESSTQHFQCIFLHAVFCCIMIPPYVHTCCCYVPWFILSFSMVISTFTPIILAVCNIFNAKHLQYNVFYPKNLLSPYIYNILWEHV